MKVFVTVVRGKLRDFEGDHTIFRKQVYSDIHRAEDEKEAWMAKALKDQQDEGSLMTINPATAKVYVIGLELVE
jgi:hypothetical protein